MMNDENLVSNAVCDAEFIENVWVRTGDINSDEIRFLDSLANPLTDDYARTTNIICPLKPNSITKVLSEVKRKAVLIKNIQIVAKWHYRESYGFSGIASRL